MYLTDYAQHSAMTDPREHAGRLRDLPSDLPSVCRVVQGLLIHPWEAHRYGARLASSRRLEERVRTVGAMLGLIAALDPRPLTEARLPAKRLIGNCRQFALLTCALLREQGTPARVRVGFAGYFDPGRYADHWTCEVWDAEQGEWRLVDAQLDAVQRRAYSITFDPCQTPRDQFLTADDAWTQCRAWQTDPRRFGLRDTRGLWYVRRNFILDLAALHKQELRPDDNWAGLIAKPDSQVTRDEYALLDRLAALSRQGNTSLAELSAVYAQATDLHPPDPAMLSSLRPEVILTTSKPLGAPAWKRRSRQGR